MSRRCAAFGVLAVAIAVLGSTPLAGQAQTTGSKPWTVGKTADGQPDLQGIWLFFETTPFEAPGGTRIRKRPGDTVPGASDAAAAARVAARAAAGAPAEVNVFYAEAAQRDPGSNRRSMVVDPPDGHVPVKDSAVEENDRLTDRFYDWYVNISSSTRCITRGVPGSMFSTAIDNAIQIMQGPGYVGLVHEFMHETRLIPVDGSPHLPQNVRLWIGDPRGHWEGNTLVVESTNYNNKGSVTNSGGTGYLQGMRQTEALHVVERFTPVSANRMNYEVTIEDSNLYTRPWKVMRPLTRDDSYKMYEYACHEGNRNLITIALGAGRLKDKGPGAEAAAVSQTRRAAEEAAKAK